MTNRCKSKSLKSEIIGPLRRATGRDKRKQKITADYIHKTNKEPYFTWLLPLPVRT